MTRLDTATMMHLDKWCDKQFTEYKGRTAAFNGMISFLESLDHAESTGYLNNSWWHTYDVARALRFM